MGHLLEIVKQSARSIMTATLSLCELDFNLGEI